jgi:membrane protein required for colicin V production
MNLSVTFLDCLIVLVIIVSAGYAAWRGFLWETLTIFAWVAAAFACLYFGPYIIPLTRSMIAQPWLASLVAYAGVFLAVFIPFAFMSHRFSESVKHSPIGPLDRAAGVLFGVVRGLVVVGLGYLAFTYFVPIRNQPHWLTEARLLPMVQSTSEVLLSVVPDHPGEYAPARPEVVRQAPSPVEPRVEQNAANPPVSPASHDPMADLIRSNGNANSVSKTTREPVQQKSASKGAKSYGATDRQALDKLIETGGNGNR